MTKERLQIEVIQLAEKANRMVKSGELSKFQAGFFLRKEMQVEQDKRNLGACLVRMDIERIKDDWR